MDGILIDVNYENKDEQLLSLYIKTSEAGFIKVYYRGFEPYFYALPNDLENAKKITHPMIKRIEVVEKFLNNKIQKLIKIICFSPKEVPKVRDLIKNHPNIDKTYEYDIPFVKRFLIDNHLIPLGTIKFEKDGDYIKIIESSYESKPEFNSIAFDIETYNKSGASNPKSDPIVMLSHSNGKKAKVMTFKQVNLPFVNSYADEKSMIKGFLDFVKKEDAEILAGYNSDQFDLPYLRERSASLKTSFSIGREGGTVKLSNRANGTISEVDGRIHLDLYKFAFFLQTIGYINPPRLTLDDVYYSLTGKHKYDFDKSKIHAAWDGDETQLKELAKYSQTDAEITYDLLQMFIPLLIELSKTSKLSIFDVCRSTTGQMAENLLIHKAFSEGVVIPNKPRIFEAAERSEKRFIGAFVKLPEPGFYENIAVVDFRSLYPSIIISYNIDPSTIDCECCLDAPKTPNGHHFCQKKQGLLPKVLDSLIKKRAEIKEKMKSLKKESYDYKELDAKQLSLKIVSNSYYGLLGFSNSRFYSYDCGSTVTALGRHYIHESIEKAEKEGFNVLYADTDSLFLLMGKKTKQNVYEFLKKINSELPGVMELSLEGFYKSGVFVSKRTEAKGAKKKYALLDENGKTVKIRGFELVRRDWSAIAKETQQKVLDIILKEGNVQKAANYVQKIIDELKNKKTPIEKLVIFTQLTKELKDYEVISPEVSAAKKAVEKGIAMNAGSVVDYIITEQGTSISEKAELAKFAKDYDSNYYINHQVLPAVLKILGALGYSESDLKTGKKQTSLFSWE